MSQRLARWLIASYPRAWRDRYGSEVADLAGELVARAETTWLRAGLDLAAGAAAEWCRALRRSAAPALAVTGAAGISAAGIGLALARARHGAAGMSPYFDAHPAGLVLLLAVLGWCLIEFAAFLRVQESREWRDGATRVRTPGFWAFAVACVVAWETWLYLAPSIVPAAAIRPGALAFAAGLVVFLSGAGLRGWSASALGRYRTAAIVISSSQPVISRGPYRMLRHPGYAGGLLICSGAGLASANWAGLAVMTLLPLAVTVWRIRLEEHALVTVLADKYTSYAAGHKRLIPLVW